SPMDLEVIADGLRAMCLHNYQNERSFRAETRAPSAPIEIDPEEWRVSTAPGAFDPVPLAYWLPPVVAARLPHGYSLELTEVRSIDEVARAIFEGAAPRSGDGYRLSARPRREPHTGGW